MIFTTSGVAIGLASGTASASGIVFGLSIASGTGSASGVAPRMALGIATGIIAGIASGTASGVASGVALGIFTGVASGVGSFFFTGIVPGVAFGVAVVIGYWRAYYHPVHLWFVWPVVHGGWYPRHPAAWDDLCALPFPGLGRLLAAYAEVAPAAAEAEIERLIDSYPTQRHRA